MVCLGKAQPSFIGRATIVDEKKAKIHKSTFGKVTFTSLNHSGPDWHQNVNFDRDGSVQTFMDDLNIVSNRIDSEMAFEGAFFVPSD